MIIALDVGNTQVYGGVFDGDRLVLSFRRNSKTNASSDETGVFLRSVLRENGIDPTRVKQILICSVVPEVIYSLRGAARKYFNCEPFILQIGVKTGLRVKYKNPSELGSDRLANAVAGLALYPERNLIIVDMGTATTFCAVSKEKDHLGGVIVPGIRLSMEVLETKTAKLPSVEIVQRKEVLGKTTIENIQSGLFYGHLGMIREICDRLNEECFQQEKAFVIGTGGFAHLYEKEGVFNAVIPDLVLKGLLFANRLNPAPPAGQGEK